jgi:hypothetical protein
VSDGIRTRNPDKRAATGLLDRGATGLGLIALCALQFEVRSVYAHVNCAVAVVQDASELLQSDQSLKEFRLQVPDKIQLPNSLKLLRYKFTASKSVAKQLTFLTDKSNKWKLFSKRDTVRVVSLGAHCSASRYLPLQVGQVGTKNWVEKIRSTYG